MIIDVLLTDQTGRALGKLIANEKAFRTGSRGYHGQGKLEIDGKRYQVQVQLVEIGSKSPEPESNPPAGDAPAPDKS